LWHFGWQTFSQVAGLQQATFSQVAGLQQATFSQVAGLQQATFSQALTLQAGLQQAGSEQQAFGAAQVFGSSQMYPFDSNKSAMSSNRSRIGVQCCLWHLGVPHTTGFSQQAGFAFSQQAGFAFSQTAGAAQHLAGFSQQATLAQALQSPQSPPFSPRMRSRSSKLNP
jgi:hypothetical protein